MTGRWFTMALAAALLALAQFAAVGAQAHPGHDHFANAKSQPAHAQAHAPEAASAVRTSPPSVIANADARADAHRCGWSRASRAILTAADDGAGEMPAQANGCLGQCCGFGAACCGAVLVASTVALLPDSIDHRRPDVATAPPNAGVDPETLPEPPKTFV